MLSQILKVSKKIILGWITFPMVALLLAVRLVNDMFDAFANIFRK